jgi:hypothetical protein
MTMSDNSMTTDYLNEQLIKAELSSAANGTFATALILNQRRSSQIIKMLQVRDAEIDAIKAERDAALDVIRRAHKAMEPLHYELYAPVLEKKNVGNMIATVINILSGALITPTPQPAPAAPVGDEYDADVDDLDGDGTPPPLAFTLASAAKWCQRAIDETDKRENYEREHEEAIQSLAYGLGDVIEYLKSKEVQS